MEGDGAPNDVRTHHDAEPGDYYDFRMLVDRAIAAGKQGHRAWAIFELVRLRSGLDRLPYERRIGDLTDLAEGWIDLLQREAQHSRGQRVVGAVVEGLRVVQALLVVAADFAGDIKYPLFRLAETLVCLVGLLTILTFTWRHMSKLLP